jgi:predicted small lipoprotein YifL
MKWIAILAVAAVAACGVDGPPERPTVPKTPPKSNVSISGHATMGVITEL